MAGRPLSTASRFWARTTCAHTYSSTSILSPSTLHPHSLQSPRLTVTTTSGQIARLQPTMEAHASYENNYTTFAIPVIKVNGKNVEGDGTAEGYVYFALGPATP